MRKKAETMEKDISSVAEQLAQIKDGEKGGEVSYAGLKEQTICLIQHLKSAMYPEFFQACGGNDSYEVDGRESLETAYEVLLEVLNRVLRDDKTAQCMADDLIRTLPEIKEILETDIQAAYEGDPAAKSNVEVLLAYPAFEAISIYRIAHKLFTMDVPILPRMMTEYAHRNTGIDIHPGATIGRYFFIDHGTGVVIGETTVIGDHVKLYQGVTLGAKSFQVGADGTLVKGIKRHPNIGNDVVIYSGATILGGETTIGDRCVIGGNVWLTHSVEAGETVLAAHGRTENISSI